MTTLWWIAGVALAVVWLDRARDARDMSRIPDLNSAEWDDRSEGAKRTSAPSVTVIVPARNEQAHIGATLKSLGQQDYPNVSVVAVDDRSSDATGAIMDEQAAASAARIRIMHISHLPDGWLGKTHAMWQAAQNDSSEWLLFTDGDVLFRHDAVRRAVAYAERSGADHLVVFPRVAVDSFSGHMMLAFFQILFVFGHRPWKVADPKASDSIGFGPFNMVRRSAYEKIGTWSKLRLAVVEDMKLGERVKQHGLASRCAFGQGLVTHHWARTGADVIRNLTKNLFAVTDYRLERGFGACVMLIALNFVPFVGVLLAPDWAKAPFIAAIAGILGLYVGMSRRSDVSVLYFLTHPLAAVLFVYAMLVSMSHVVGNGGVVWRGTKYSLEELRRESA